MRETAVGYIQYDYLLKLKEVVPSLYQSSKIYLILLFSNL